VSIGQVVNEGRSVLSFVRTKLAEEFILPGVFSHVRFEIVFVDSFVGAKGAGEVHSFRVRAGVDDQFVLAFGHKITQRTFLGGDGGRRASFCRPFGGGGVLAVSGSLQSEGNLFL